MVASVSTDLVDEHGWELVAVKALQLSQFHCVTEIESSRLEAHGLKDKHVHERG